MSIRLPLIASVTAAFAMPALVGNDPLGADQAEPNPANMIAAERNLADTDAALPDTEPLAADTPGAAFPTDVTRFDIECSLTHVETRRAHPGDPMPSEPLRRMPYNFRLSVDLEAMVHCGAGCTHIDSYAVASADAERIVLDWAPGITSWLRRSDGYYYRWFDHAPVIFETGQCRRAPFTEFSTPLEPDRWNYPDTQRAFGIDARRFDMVCELRRERWGRPPDGELPNLPWAEDVPLTLYRQSVDLDAMLYCPEGCREPRPILSFGRNAVRFEAGPDEVSWLESQSGHWQGRSRDAAGFEEFQGWCSQAPFTPFPGSGRTGAPGWRPSNPHKVP
jgi:hypothetical protein